MEADLETTVEGKSLGGGPADGRAGMDVLVRLVGIATRRLPPTEMAQAMLDAVTEDLGLSGGVVSLAGESDAGPALLPTAFSGSHASLLREAPAIPLDSEYDAAAVWRDRQGRYTGEIYEAAEEPGQGTSRWREMMSVQSEALLPLMLGGEAIGAMSLRWSSPQVFGPPARELLEAVASLTALAVEHAGFHARRADELEARPTFEVARFEVTAEGVVVARPVEGEWSGGETLRVTLSWIESDAVTSVYDVIAPESGRMSLLLAITATDIPEDGELTETLRHTARALARQGAEPSDVLCSLNARVGELAPSGTLVDAFHAVFDVGTGALHHSSAGEVRRGLRAADGREWDLTETGDPLGASPGSEYSEDVWILVPGDEVDVSVAESLSVKVVRARRG